MNISMGERIRVLRKDKGWTQKELGEKLGLKKETITKYEKGIIVNLKRDTIAKMADLFGVDPASLIGYHASYKDYGIAELPATYSVPILGSIACGAPIFADENYEGSASVDTRYDVDFALICRGDSMINARIFDGDLVYIRKQETVENGEIAAVIIDNEATLKRVYKYTNRLELRPENPTYKVMNFEGEELEDIRIIGKAIVFSSLIR